MTTLWISEEDEDGEDIGRYAESSMPCPACGYDRAGRLMLTVIALCIAFVIGLVFGCAAGVAGCAHLR